MIMYFSTVTVSLPQRNDPLALPGVINFHVDYSGTAVQDTCMSVSQTTSLMLIFMRSFIEITRHEAAGWTVVFKDEV